MDEGREYIAAVRRDRRDEAPDEWQSTLRAIEGVEVLTPANSPRLHITATPEALKEATDRLGGFLHIEPVIEHKPTRSTSRF